MQPVVTSPNEKSTETPRWKTIRSTHPYALSRESGRGRIFRGPGLINLHARVAKRGLCWPQCSGIDDHTCTVVCFRVGWPTASDFWFSFPDPAHGRVSLRLIYSINRLLYGFFRDWNCSLGEISWLHFLDFLRFTVNTLDWLLTLWKVLCYWLWCHVRSIVYEIY